MCRCQQRGRQSSGKRNTLRERFILSQRGSTKTRNRLPPRYRSITLIRFPDMFSTYSFRSVKANADGPSSVSGGFGVRLPILFPFKSNTRMASKCVLDAYKRRPFESMARSSKPAGGPHSGTDHLVRNFPFSSNTCIRLLIGSAT